MSSDMVDMLHDAEDTIGALRLALEAVLEHAERQPWTGLGDTPEVLDKVRSAAAIGRAYCRCEYDKEEQSYACDEDCGCPAEHEHPHGTAQDV